MEKRGDFYSQTKALMGSLLQKGVERLYHDRENFGKTQNLSEKSLLREGGGLSGWREPAGFASKRDFLTHAKGVRGGKKKRRTKRCEGALCLTNTEKRGKAGLNPPQGKGTFLRTGQGVGSNLSARNLGGGEPRGAISLVKEKGAV